MFKSLFVKLGLVLFSILAVVVTLGVTLGVVTDAFACLTKGYAHKCYTATGVVLWSRSEVSGPLLLADEDITVGDTLNGTFATVASTRENQAVACKFDALDGKGPKDALCSYPDPGISCTGFVIEPCNFKTGTRTSFMSCTTPKTLPGIVVAPGEPVTGCSGTVTVTFLDGSGSTQINVAKDPNLNTDGECNRAYPKTLQLNRGIGGKVVQLCSKAEWSFEDRVLEHVVRNQLSGVVPNTASYAASGKWSDQADAKCQPDDGFPPVSCKNNSIVRSTFPANSAACSAANYICGQRPDGSSSGQPPEDCTFDSSSGQCTCTCTNCAKDTGKTLTNVGIPPSAGVQGTGSYVVLQKNGQIANICPVKVGGQQ
jgi:hypothetical protein